MKCPDSVFFNRYALSDLPNQPRIFQDSSSDHHRWYLLETVTDYFIFLFCANIPIVTEWIFTVFDRIFKHFQIRSVLIEICLDPRMNDQLLHWILIVNFQKPDPFFRALLANPCLNRNTDRCLFKKLF